MDAQALLWFGIGGGAAWFGVSLLYQRYVKKMFAILMFLFAIGAVAAGIVASV
jgi:hypothetical protein